MAAKKKAKSKKAKPKKAKKAKAVKAKKPAAKKAKAKKKVVAKKAPAKKAPTKKVAAKKPAPAKKRAAPKPAPAAAPATIPGAEPVGVVTHYFNHLSVAIIQLNTGTLRSGETVHVKGHTSDFRQTVGSMEVDHVHVDEVRAGQSFGLRVNEHAREHDVVYKVLNP